jgi:hypothetical protein
MSLQYVATDLVWLITCYVNSLYTKQPAGSVGGWRREFSNAVDCSCFSLLQDFAIAVDCCKNLQLPLTFARILHSF